jgi:hypothetical protein
MLASETQGRFGAPPPPLPLPLLEAPPVLEVLLELVLDLPPVAVVDAPLWEQAANERMPVARAATGAK